jgi:hypothetical protein
MQQVSVIPYHKKPLPLSQSSIEVALVIAPLLLSDTLSLK